MAARRAARRTCPTEVSDAPAQTTILGAAKLTGRAGPFSIGVLNAVTGDEDAMIANGVQRTRQTIEPLTSYSVARARREFADQSALGFMMTATNRNLDDATRFLAGQAYTGGIDWDWRLKSRYAVQGYVVGSSIHGEPEAISELQESNVHSFQRPDAGHIELDPTRTSLNGYGLMMAISKIGGERVRFNSNVSMKSPGFDINDVGFMQRADQRNMSNWVQVRYERPTKWFRSFRYNLNQWAGWNYDGDRLNLGFNVNAHIVFLNHWGSGMGVNLNPQSFDDRATRGGPGAFRNQERSVWGYIEGDQRKPVSMSIFSFVAADDLGTSSWDISPTVNWRPSSFLTLNTGVSVSRDHDQSQWIEQLDDRYIFGELDQRTVAIRTRLNYTVTPTLTIQLYAEPFVSAGDYTTFKQLADGRARDYDRRYAPVEYSDNPDFNYRSFRTTNVLRWEYRPGSTLFVVWQQGREDELTRGTFDFKRDFGGVFSAPARNVFLVKWAYWLNF